MSDFKHVNRGEEISIKASVWNAVLDAAQGFKQQSRGRTPISRSQPYNSAVLLIRNDHDEAVERGRALGISGVVVTPADNEDEFRNHPVLTGEPITDGHPDIVVCLDSIQPNEIGRCVIEGLAVAVVEIVDSNHRYAYLPNGSIVLETAPAGPVEIVWMPDATGEHPALVRIGKRSDRPFVVRVAQDGGEDGNNTTAATWTYTVKTLDGDTIAEEVEVIRPRPIGSMEAQADGFGLAVWVEEDGEWSLKLWDAGENEAVIACD